MAHIPFLEIAFSKSIEAVGAYRRHTAEDNERPRSSEWEISFILEGLKAPRRGHISAKPTSQKRLPIYGPLRTVCMALTLEGVHVIRYKLCRNKTPRTL